MRWLAHRGGAQHHRRWSEAKREPLPAAAVIGADPGTILAAVTPVPDTLSEYQFAGLLRGTTGRAGRRARPCRSRCRRRPRSCSRAMSRSTTTATKAPTATTPAITMRSSVSRCSSISAITMRRDPIYLTTFTGRPPDEPSVLGEALNEVFIPLLQQQFPEIVDFWLPPEGCSYRIAVVSIRRAYPGHAKRVMMGVWSFPAPVRLHQVGDRGRRRHRRARLEGRDVGGLDPHGPGARHHRRSRTRRSTISTSPRPSSGLGGKIGLDATNKWPPETHRDWGRKIRMDDAVVEPSPRNGRASACRGRASRCGNETSHF